MSSKSNLFLGAVSAFMVLFTGCRVDITQEPLAANGLEASLNTNIPMSTLKMTGNQFEPQDEVGLYMKKAGQDLTVAGSIYLDVNNKQMSFIGQKLISTPALNYPKSGNVDFIAYYPYTPAVNNDFTFDVSVAGQEKRLPVELLYSNNIRQQAPTTSEVTLNFFYSYAKLAITVKSGENSPLVEADFEDMTASLKGMFTKAKFNIANGTLTDKADRQEIKMFKTGFTPTQATFEALILPTTIDDGVITFEFYANGETYMHRQTTNYKSHSLYKLLFELNFTPPTAILLNTQIFPRDEYQETIPIDASAQKVFIIDMSEKTDWDFLMLGIDGSSVFLNVDENTDLPTSLYFKPDINNDEGYSIFFGANGLPETMVVNDYIITFNNFRGNFFDFALIHPDNTIEYFYDIYSDADWDDFAASLTKSSISKASMSKASFEKVLGKVFKVAVKNAIGGLQCGLNTAAAIGTGGLAIVGAVTSCGSFVANITLDALNEFGVQTPTLSAFLTGVDMGLTAWDCISAFSPSPSLIPPVGTGVSDMESCIMGVADLATGFVFDAFGTTQSKASTISNAQTVLNTPIIKTNIQPSYANATTGNIFTVLSVNASVNLPSTLTYQWYSNSSNSISGGAIISGATSATYAIPKSLIAGMYYYFCVVTATGTGNVGTSFLLSSVATVSVNDPPVIPKPEREYLDASRVRQTLPDAIPLVDYINQTTLGSVNETRWVRVEGTQIAGGRITIYGDVHLILRDGCHLNATNGGINVSGNNKLTIYAQSTGANMGKLSANGANAINGGNTMSGGGGRGGNAGIGSDGGTPNHDSSGSAGNSAGSITINGGEITAMGGNGGTGGSGWAGGAGGAGAGIGGGGGAGGAATAGLGSNGKAGGSGGYGGSVIINGGTVFAYWGTAGAGGSRDGGNGGGGGGGRGAGIGAGGGGGGGGGYSAGGTGSAGGIGNSGQAIGDGGSGGSGGKGGTTLFVGGTNGGNGGGGNGGGTCNYPGLKKTDSTNHVKIAP